MFEWYDDSDGDDADGGENGWDGGGDDDNGGEDGEDGDDNFNDYDDKIKTKSSDDKGDGFNGNYISVEKSNCGDEDCNGSNGRERNGNSTKTKSAGKELTPKINEKEKKKKGNNSNYSGNRKTKITKNLFSKVGEYIFHNL